MNGVSTIAVLKFGSGLDQMNWQEVVKLLRIIFAYADVKLVVYTLEEHGVQRCPLRETLSSMLTMK